VDNDQAVGSWCDVRRILRVSVLSTNIGGVNSASMHPFAVVERLAETPGPNAAPGLTLS
jgi:hypothetical protein